MFKVTDEYKHGTGDEKLFLATEREEAHMHSRFNRRGFLKAGVALAVASRAGIPEVGAFEIGRASCRERVYVLV